jgi:hypothetical protein
VGVAAVLTCVLPVLRVLGALSILNINVVCVHRSGKQLRDWADALMCFIRTLRHLARVAASWLARNGRSLQVRVCKMAGFEGVRGFALHVSLCHIIVITL